MNPTLRTVVLSILLIALVAGGIYFLRPHANLAVSCAEKSPAPTIVAFGDSLVEGYGASSLGGFVSILSQEAGVPITNLGKNGDTTAQAKERLASVTALRPTITFVLLGGNDALQGVPQTETEQNLGEIISTLQKTGSRVVLLGVLGGFPSDPYASMFSKLAKMYGVTYVPNVLSGLIGHTDLMSDSVHPNQAGYQKIADRLLPILQAECAKK